eukprot:GHVH01010979.1.p1 GENE.GHVH01010979.1~~GHVH01010979.1.p1  ORF type:complete len:777 (+),score=119.04 GHVH01010979.1:22-2331(+)
MSTPARFDPALYEINAVDVAECTVTAKDLGSENAFQMAEEMQLLVAHTPDTIREKYARWTARFKEYEPLAVLDMSTVVVAFNIPSVSADKKEKLLKLVKHVVSKKMKTEALIMSHEINIDKLTFNLVLDPDCDPDSDDQNYMSVGFVACRLPSIAAHVAEIMDGIKLGKNAMSCCVMSDVDSYFDPVVAADMKAISSVPHVGLTSHLHDSMGREQFLVSNSEKMTDVLWNDPVLKEPQGLSDKAPITCLSSHWSSFGSYLFTIHELGVWVRGGPKLQKLFCVEHEFIWEMLNSPDERYLLTWDGLPNTEGSHLSVLIHDLWTGLPVASSWTPSLSCDGSEKHPFFAWSACSKYLACNSGSSVIILEVPNFKPLMREDGEIWSIPLKNPRSSFSWSPVDPYIAVWTPPVGTDTAGRGDGPCSLKVVDVENRRDLASKSLNVEVDNLASLIWHPQGTYFALRLAVLEKITKKKRNPKAQIEVFHIHIKGCPSDSILVPTDTSVLNDVAFEPMGDRLALLMSDSLKIWTLKRDASKANSQEVANKVLGPMTRFNHIFWSPQGVFFVLAGIDEGDGTISFNSVKVDKNVVSIDESHRENHYAMNKICWDYSGRYLTSVVRVTVGPKTDYSKKAMSSYRIWSFQGKEIFYAKNIPVGSILDFQWRPHPKPILSAKKMTEVQRNVATYGDKYGMNDDLIRSAAKSEVETKKQSLQHKFQAHLDAAVTALAKDPMSTEWFSCWGEFDKSAYNCTYEEVEESAIISTEVKIVKQKAT